MMQTIYRENSQPWKGGQGIVDLRTTAYVIAVWRITARCEAIGNIDKPARLVPPLMLGTIW